MHYHTSASNRSENSLLVASPWAIKSYDELWDTEMSSNKKASCHGVQISTSSDRNDTFNTALPSVGPPSPGSIASHPASSDPASTVIIEPQERVLVLTLDTVVTAD